MSSLYLRLNILLPEGTAVDDNNGGAFGPIHKVYDIWLDDFERRSMYFSAFKLMLYPWIAAFPCKYILIVLQNSINDCFFTISSTVSEPTLRLPLKMNMR
jgi:hypothetical protein